MASSNFIPDREAELRTWSRAFDRQINLDPVALGLTAAQATHYSTLNLAFVDLLALTSSNAGNTSSNVFAKNTAKKTLITQARSLARIIRANPNVTEEQLTKLGLHVSEPGPRRVPVPAQPPMVRVTRVSGRMITVQLRDKDRHGTRARPKGVIGATVYAFIGAQPPRSAAGWTVRGQTSRTTVNVNFDTAIEPGSRVWITACWVNPRLEWGPIAEPVFAYIEYGGGMQTNKDLRLAA